MIKPKRSNVDAEHENALMVELIQGLPPFELFAFHTPDQHAYVKCERQIWRAIGQRLEFLQRRQLGFRVKDPTSTLPIQIKESAIVTSDLFYALLDVLIEGFDVIEAYARKTNRDLPDSPRDALYVICYEFAGRRLYRATSTDTVAGPNLKAIRTTESDLGKFIRGSLKEEAMTAMLENMEQSGYVVDLCIVALYRLVGLARLKKWKSWKAYAKAQTAYRRFVSRNDVLAIKWLDGKAVYTNTDSPARDAFLT